MLHRALTRTVFIALALFAPLLAPADELINQPPDNPLPPKPYADGCEGCGDCSEGTETGNDCVSFSQRFGRTPLVAGAPVGRLRVVEFTAARLPAEVSEIAVRTAFSDEASDPARLTALLVLESGGHPKALEAARRLSALRHKRPSARDGP